MWGKDTVETFDILTAKYGSRSAIVCIGPAGERMVRLANIMSEGLHARAAGRSGMGAVMGSKQLKAVVADGTLRTPIAHPKELQQSIRDYTPFYVEKMKRYRAFGTPGGTVGSAVIADLSGLQLDRWRLRQKGRAPQWRNHAAGPCRREVSLSAVCDRVREGSARS